MKAEFLEQLTEISEGSDNMIVEFPDSSDIDMSPDLAQSLINIYEELNDQNKVVFLARIETSADDLMEALNDYCDTDSYQEDDPFMEDEVD